MTRMILNEEQILEALLMATPRLKFNEYGIAEFRFLWFQKALRKHYSPTACYNKFKELKSTGMLVSGEPKMKNGIGKIDWYVITTKYPKLMEFRKDLRDGLSYEPENTEEIEDDMPIKTSPKEKPKCDEERINQIEKQINNLNETTMHLNALKNRISQLNRTIEVANEELNLIRNVILKTMEGEE